MTVRADDFDDAYSAQLRGDYELAVTLYSRTLDDDALSDDDVATAHLNRGSAHSITGRYRDALTDFDAALTGRPDSVDAHFNRGAALFNLGEFEASIHDFRATLGLDPRNPFAVIWLYLAQARAGHTDRDALLAQARDLDLELWPGPIVAFLLGRVPVSDLVSRARDQDPDRMRARTCEMSFLRLPRGLLLNARREEERWARGWLEKAIDACPLAFMEYSGAKAELERQAARETPNELPPRRYIATVDVNYRAGPGTQFERLGTLPRDSTVKVDGVESGWYRLRFDDGERAFVHSRYLRSQRDAVTAGAPRASGEHPVGPLPGKALLLTCPGSLVRRDSASILGLLLGVPVYEDHIAYVV